MACVGIERDRPGLSASHGATIALGGGHVQGTSSSLPGPKAMAFPTWKRNEGLNTGSFSEVACMPGTLGGTIRSHKSREPRVGCDRVERGSADEADRQGIAVRLAGAGFDRGDDREDEVEEHQQDDERDADEHEAERDQQQEVERD